MKRSLLTLALLVSFFSSVTFAGTQQGWVTFNFDTSALTQLGATELNANFSTSNWQSGDFNLTQSPTATIGIGSNPLTGLILEGYGDQNGIIEVFKNSKPGSCNLVGNYAGTYDVKLGAKLIKQDGIIADYNITCTVSN